MLIKPLFNIDWIKDPFWYGFMSVFSHIVWLWPIGFVVGFLLRGFLG